MADDKTTSGSQSGRVGSRTSSAPRRIRYIDRPEIDEVFADAVTGLLYDGQTLRMEFAVTRFDEIKPNMPISGRRYPACRLALSPAARSISSTACSRSRPRSRKPARQSLRRGRAHRSVS